MSNFIKFFQKIKWDILARINPDYYINSKLLGKDENKYKESGDNDVQRFILQDTSLKSIINFKEASILEIGCGNGRMTEFLARSFKRVYAVDISPKMIELGKLKFASLKNIDFFVGDGLHYLIPNNTVDLVFSYIVFQHFPTMGMVLENMGEVKRVLKSGGLAKIQFRGKPTFGGVFRIFKWYYGVYLTKEKVSDLARKLDLQILSISGEETKEMWVIFKRPTAQR